MKRLTRKEAKRAGLPVPTWLGECGVGDQVDDQNGVPLVITSFLCGQVFVRRWDPEAGESCSEPLAACRR